MQTDKLVEEFLFHCSVERQLSKNTVNAYKRDLKHFRHFCTHRGEEALSCELFKAYLACMVGPMQLSTSTARRRLSCLRAFCAYVCPRNDLFNPFKTWAPSLKRPSRLPRALTLQEVQNLVGQKGSETTHQVETIFRLMLLSATGLRISEFCGVNIQDVSVDGTSIRVNGKGSRERIVYIGNDRLKDRLAQARADARQSRDANKPMFLNRIGSRLQPQVFRRRIHALTADRGIDRRITPHMLRHTTATLLIENGADIRFVQRLLGHASIATTEIYTHVSDAALRRAISDADPLLRIMPNPDALAC